MELAGSPKRPSHLKNFVGYLCSNMQFLTSNKHTISNFSSKMSRYTRQKFHLGRCAVGVRHMTRRSVAPLAPLPHFRTAPMWRSARTRVAINEIRRRSMRQTPELIIGSIDGCGSSSSSSSSIGDVTTLHASIRYDAIRHVVWPAVHYINESSDKADG